MAEPPKFYPGQALTAAQLNAVVDAVVQRFTGRAPILVNKNGGQVVVALHDDRIVSKAGPGDPIDISPEDNGITSAGHTHRGMPQPSTYATFPAIPTDGTVIIYVEKGAADDGLWIATEGDSAWTPLSGMTDKTGAPGT